MSRTPDSGSPRVALLAIASAAVLLLLLLVWQRGVEEGGPARMAPRAPDASADAPMSSRAEPQWGPAGSADVVARARGPLPASLRGTDVDGSLMLGADGHFVPTADALALFDYFLAASGEEPLAVIRQRILDAIHEQLPSTAAAEATALLDTYLGYREALRTLAEAGDAPADLERRLQWLRELRRTHFGGQSELLFAESEATSVIDLERRRVALDPELSEEERAARLAALEEQLPERVRTSRQRARAPAELRAEVAGIRASGGSEAEVFAAREARFGAEAAERLAAEDVRRQRWRDRLAQYGAERDALRAELASEGAPPATVDEALEALRRTHFEDDELRRVRALDGAL